MYKQCSSLHAAKEDPVKTKANHTKGHIERVVSSGSVQRKWILSQWILKIFEEIQITD